MADAPDLSRYALLDGLLEGCQVLGFDWRYLYVNDVVVAHSRTTRDELIGRRMMDAFPGIEQTPMFAVLRRCMADRTPDHLENEFTYPDGTSSWFELRVEPVPEGLFVLSLDITARMHAERRMERQLERLRSLRAIDLAILGTTNFRLALRTVLEETAKRLDADAAVILLLGASSTRLEAVAALGFRSAAVGRLSVRLGEGLLGRAALECHTLTTTDVSAGDDGDDVPALLVEEGLRGLSVTPLVAKGQLVGILAAGRRSPHQADEESLGFLESLAGQAAMAVDAGRSFEDLQKAHLELELAYETTIEGWAAALDLRDRETANHTFRVAELTLDLARTAGMSEADLVHVRRGALLHDIGKMAIPDSILLKRDSLTPGEIEVMKRHPGFAHDLLAPIAYLRPALDIPYCHHEHWDGTGYPRGLKGEAIPLAARLFAVVDVWDAMRSERPYREGWSDARAREHLRSLAGTHLDPLAVELFTRMMGERERGVAET
jgi:HD-GYP domain-containing protein (c-di-GMP phosphodiesterase class II)